MVQIYEGLVYMDFSEALMLSRGFGQYENLPLLPSELPFLYLSYLGDPSDSGRIHSDVRRRFDGGDEGVAAAMRRFARLTEEAREELLKAGGSSSAEKDWSGLAGLMNENFELRRRVYGDECLGRQNIRMVEIGREFGAACKFPGTLFGFLKNLNTRVSHF